MPQPMSVIQPRAATAAAVLLALLAAVAFGPHAFATSSASSVKSTAISLEQSATAIPLNGRFGFTGVVRLTEKASDLQARLQVHLPSGKVVFQRTKYETGLVPGDHRYGFSRELDGLDLKAGSYPVAFSVKATVNGDRIDTETVGWLRIYDPKRAPVKTVLLAKVHSRPLVDSSGRFAVDPATPDALRTQEQIDRVAALVSADTSAAITLSVPPALLEQWKRISTTGYTLASGTVVPATDPTSLKYASTLGHLQSALSSGRLELLTAGYSDPNLADLAANKMLGDVEAQYDAGLSACFASISATPSVGTAPAGGCVPAAMQSRLITSGVSYTFADAQSTRLGKRPPASGAYPCADSKMTALVVDALPSNELESGESSAVVTHTLERQAARSGQPVILRIDLDETVVDATATVGFALATLDALPWTRTVLGKDVQVPRKAGAVKVVPAVTSGAPTDYWKTIRTARMNAEGLLAALSASDAKATTADTNSLLSQADAWSEPRGSWQLSSSGLELARAAVRSGKDVFSAVSISVQSITLASSTGQIPITIRNNSSRTLNVTVIAKTGGGARVVGDRVIKTTLPPQETFLQIPVDLQSTLRGRLAVQVLAGPVVVTKQSAVISRSYLDRLALMGTVILVLGGMLMWIVLRVRRAPSIDAEVEESNECLEPHE
jgi:hypothetical protein